MKNDKYQNNKIIFTLRSNPLEVYIYDLKTTINNDYYLHLEPTWLS